MTAINVFRQRYRAAILTDAAGYDAEGIVQGFYAKTAVIPHLNAAVASRGTAVTTALYASNFGLRFQSFDALVEGAGDFARELFEDSGSLFYSGEDEVQIFIAGWSEERNRPETYFVVSNDREGFEPWTLIECDAALAAPVPENLAAFGFDMSKRPEDLDFVGDGLKILEAQRAMKLNVFSYDEDADFHVVGGFALLTEIKRDGVTQRVIHRWEEDKIGEPIRPVPVEQRYRLQPGMPMNRQQRRAMEREMKKRSKVAA